MPTELLLELLYIMFLPCACFRVLVRTYVYLSIHVALFFKSFQ